MNLDDAIEQLEALGSEQTRKTWRRHGAAEPMFGVKFGDLTKLQKRIKVDHILASELWHTGNHDARLLACMVADATTITEKELKAWASEVKDSSTAEALAAFASGELDTAHHDVRGDRYRRPRNTALRKAAEEAISRIGPVAFDPGNTACEFPDPLPYIAKVWDRKKS